MKQNLRGVYLFLKTGFKVSSLMSLCIYAVLRVIFWGMPFEVLEEISIPVQVVLIANILFVVAVFSFLLLERAILHISYVVVPALLIQLKKRSEAIGGKEVNSSGEHAYQTGNSILYKNIVAEKY